MDSRKDYSILICTKPQIHFPSTIPRLQVAIFGNAIDTFCTIFKQIAHTFFLPGGTFGPIEPKNVRLSTPNPIEKLTHSNQLIAFWGSTHAHSSKERIAHTHRRSERRGRGFCGEARRRKGQPDHNHWGAPLARLTTTLTLDTGRGRRVATTKAKPELCC